MSVTKEQVIEFLSGLNVLELAELTTELEDKWGVKASSGAPIMMAAAPGAGGDAPAAAVKEEQTEFSVILSNAGEKKIHVIKVVRAITGLGLKEAKDLVDGAPQPVKEGVDKEEAEKIKKELEEQGASVEIK